MAELQQIIQQAGPLPISATATIETDAPTAVTLAGSVWTGSPNCTIGVALSIDGMEVAAASIFSNGPDTHRAVVPVTFPYTFATGPKGPEPHSFELTALTPETTSDYNDFFSVSVLY